MTGAVLSPSATHMGLRAALLPLSSRPVGTLTQSGFVQPVFVSGIRQSPDVFVVLGLAWVHHTLALAAFLALPHTRRRAKVRWRHFGRLYAYGLVGGPVCAITTALSPTAGFLLLAAHAFVFQFIWWSLGSARYLALEAPCFVGMSVWGIGLGATPIVAGLLSMGL